MERVITKKIAPADELQPLHPDYIYRVDSDVAIAVIGLGPSQRKAAIDKGELPPPLNLTPSGRAKGWLGRQLIELQARRLAEAEAEAARRQTDTPEQPAAEKPPLRREKRGT